MTDDPLALDPAEEEEFRLHLEKSRAVRAKLKRRWQRTALFIAFSTFGAKIAHVLWDKREEQKVVKKENITSKQEKSKTVDLSKKNSPAKTTSKYSTKHF